MGIMKSYVDKFYITICMYNIYIHSCNVTYQIVHNYKNYLCAYNIMGFEVTFIGVSKIFKLV